MATFFMFGKYSHESLKDASPQRTQKVKEIAGKHGGEVKSIHALLGEHDLVLIAEFPDTEKAMAASLHLAKQLGISFATSPAVDVEKFDSMLSG